MSPPPAAQPPAPRSARGVEIDATWISLRLYVGRRPPTGPYLREAGFDVLVLCALPEEYEQVYETRWEDLPRRFDRLSVLQAPLDDSGESPNYESIAHARCVADYVAGRVLRGKRAILTCLEGRNRSAFVAALALHRLTGRSGDDCAARVREMRQVVTGANRPVLCNPFFNAILSIVDEQPLAIAAAASAAPPPRKRDASHDSSDGAP